MFQLRPRHFASLLVCLLATGSASLSVAQMAPALKQAQGQKIAAPDVQDDPALVAALKGPQRPATDVARDGARHPLESLTFWGLRPGQTVLELFPGGGYWVRILAPYAKATGGRYITTVSDVSDPKASDQARARVLAFEAKWSDHATYGEVQFAPIGPKVEELAPPASVDFVLTARNIHNLLWTPGELAHTLSLAFAALKPGGVLAVEEHRADPRPQIGDARDGYVAVATVISAAQAAGFVYDGASEVNANPKDDKNHPFGVWTLPPERQSAPDGKPDDPNFNHAPYDAVGESDRMTLRFRKPG